MGNCSAIYILFLAVTYMIICSYFLCGTVGSNCYSTSSLHTGCNQGYIQMESFLHDWSNGYRPFFCPETSHIGTSGDVRLGFTNSPSVEE